MIKKETRPFRPYVTLEQIYAFDKTRPETFTVSPLVNTVLSLFGDARFVKATEIGRYLELDSRHISDYLLIATGYKLNELRRLWTLHKAEQYKAEHPFCTEDEVAQFLGYKDHSSLWHIIHAEEQNRRQNEKRHKIMRKIRGF